MAVNNGKVTVTTSSTLILSANDKGKKDFVAISNYGSVNVTLSVGEAAVAGEGMLLAPSATLVLSTTDAPGCNNYDIYGIAASSTAEVGFSEVVASF